MNSLLGKHWHHLSKEEVLDLLDSNLQNGLDVFEIKHRRERFGFNVLTPKKGKSPLMRFLLQFNNPLVIILMVASLITAMLKDPTDALVIFGVVMINAIIGYIVAAYPARLDSIPFDSQHQFMATLHADGTVYVKGAAEVLLERCAGALNPTGQVVA
jgi:magnesium-transporting ATPase (P-type)